MKIYNPAEQRAKYEWFKAHHICTACKRERAFENMTMCPACLEKNSVYAAKYRERNPEKARAANRRSYAKKKADGRCVDCGKPNPDAGENCRCRVCNRDFKIRQNLRRGHVYKPDGICRICDKPVYGEKSLCYEHWVIAKENMLKVRQSNEGHPWRADEKARRAGVKNRRQA